MTKNTTGIITIIAGAAVFLVCLFADQIGIGDKDPDHFTLGVKQISGMIIGGVIFITGIILKKKNNF